MKLAFEKYQGTGNDFVMINGLSHTIELTTKQVAFLCDRRFGIGGDGLIIIQQHGEFDFEMIYYNADGKISSMCGNGGRCIVAFAEYLKHIKESCQFMAIDGLHEGTILDNGAVSIKMSEVYEWEKRIDTVILDTGSPHYIHFVDDIKDVDIVDYGKSVRYSEEFKQEGINVNLIESHSDHLKILTYERGVEDETMSCGTGVVAAVLSDHITERFKGNERNVQARGGHLKVSFDETEGGYSNIWLTGPATRVYGGEITIPSLD